MKKKLFSNKDWFKIWAFYHGTIILLFAASLFFTRGIVFDADYTSMMPTTADGEAAKIADSSVSKNSGSSVFILVGHKDFAKAKNAAVQALELLSPESAKFKSVELYADNGTAEDVQRFLHKYRFNLLSSENCEKLNEQSGPEIFAENALASIFGGFSMTSLENLAEDPFLLDEENLKNYIKAVSESGTSMSPKDGVLASEFEGCWYVMLRCTLTEEGARLASKKNAVPFIYEKLLPLEKDGVRFVFYGTPFHSYKSSSSASAEISVISTVSMIAVIVILLFVFRSGLPLFASLFSISASLVTAFCATHLLFGKIHMTALVFGTSLIGSCIDYSLHYFINWKCTKELDSSEKIRRHIFNGLILSLISTELCFFMLVFAPFGMLRQMAVFSFTGILSSFLTVTGFFTQFKLPQLQNRRIPLVEKFSSIRLPLNEKAAKKSGLVVSLVILAVCSVILGYRHKDLRIQNNISNLYKMEGRLKEDTITAYKIMNYNPTSWLIASAPSIEELLCLEEKIMPLIPDSFVCTAGFIPSVERQKKSIEASSKLLPLAAAQFEYLGFDEESEVDFAEALSNASKNYVTPESELPQSLKSLLNMLWIGKNGGMYYSMILPSKISDENVYKNIAQTFDGVFYENKVKDISAGLDKLTWIIIVMFASAFLMIAVLMKFFYNWQDTLKIISIPVLSVLVIFTVFVLAGLKIEFFCVTGVILVFGLGLDYVIYRLENKSNSTETFAIALSFLTTAISFGALALSSFVPVHVIGLSIFSGLITAFILAVL